MRANDFEAAWAINDAVLAARDPAQADDPTLPYHRRWVWDGRPFDNRRVLVRCYHGLGDTIQFARYLAPLRSRASHMTIEVQPELAGLLHGMADRIHPFDPAQPLPPADVDIEIMELAHALRLPPDPAPYLHAKPSPQDGIGLCWQAGGWDPSRSIPASALHPLRLLPLISLQRGPAAADAATIGAIDPLRGSMDIHATTSLVAGLDAVITVDTMIAHLAAALGRPTIVLLPDNADWRWGRGPRCAWYRTAQLVRQPRPGQWAPAVQAALACIGALIRTTRA
jgi:hypothetical protein